jgi:hypothetical protein
LRDLGRIGEVRQFLLGLPGRLEERRCRVRARTAGGPQLIESHSTGHPSDGERHDCSDADLCADDREPTPSRNDYRLRDRLEWRRSKLCCELRNIGFELPAVGAALEVCLEHAELELRKLGVEPQGHLCSNPLTVMRR